MNFKKLAEVLVGYSTGVKPGDVVCIVYEPLAATAALEVFKAVVDAGGVAFFDTYPDGVNEHFFEHASESQLKTVSPMALWYRSHVDVMIYLRAPSNTRFLGSVDPARQALRNAATRPLIEITNKRSEAGELRWVLTEIPTNAVAQDASWSITKLDEFVTKTAMLHLDNPTQYWKAFGAWQQGIVDWLNDGRNEVHILGPHIDLRLSVKGRAWINCAGQHNFVDGEVFTGPVETSATGWLKLKHPAFYKGNAAEGVSLTFEDGRIIKATATKGEAFLNKTLDSDNGARFLGELGIGTHAGITEPTGSILFDEKRGGTVHVAAGMGYPETGNHNDSGVHWDMIVDLEDEGTITVDGKVIYEHGAFTIGDPDARPAVA